MPCEKYQDALTELAARGAEVSGIMRQHLNVCASCQSYLEQEQVLFTSVDSGVRQTINAPLPASLLQRLHARLAQQAPARRLWSTNRIYTVAALATAAIVVGIVGVNYHSHRSPTSLTEGTVELRAVPVAKAVPSTVFPDVARVGTENVTRRRRSIRKISVPREAVAHRSEPEVLVPPGQEALLTEYVRALQNRTMLARAGTFAGTSAIQPLVVASNQIPELEVKPLPDLQSK